jgi:methionine synthase I (cobalamin-dependent)
VRTVFHPSTRRAPSRTDYGLEEYTFELNRASASLAREAADAAMAADPSRPRFVCGAMGPTNRTASISPSVEDPSFRNVNFMELVDAYTEQLQGLLAGGEAAVGGGCLSLCGSLLHACRRPPTTTRAQYPPTPQAST